MQGKVGSQCHFLFFLFLLLSLFLISPVSSFFFSFSTLYFLPLLSPPLPLLSLHPPLPSSLFLLLMLHPLLVGFHKQVAPSTLTLKIPLGCSGGGEWAWTRMDSRRP